MTKYEFLFHDSFLHTLQQLPEGTQLKIKKKLKYFTTHPEPLCNAVRLRGYSYLWRFRVEDYRIIFTLENTTITLILVKHRKEVYRDY